MLKKNALALVVAGVVVAACGPGPDTTNAPAEVGGEAAGADTAGDDTAADDTAADDTAADDTAGHDVVGDDTADDASPFVIESIVVGEVTPCPCRCTSETTTRLTVLGANFVEGAVAIVDDEWTASYLVPGALDVQLVTAGQQAPGGHVLVVRSYAADGSVDRESAPTPFTLP